MSINELSVNQNEICYSDFWLDIVSTSDGVLHCFIWGNGFSYCLELLIDTSSTMNLE